MTDPKPTPQQIVFAQSSLTHLRTKLRDVDRLDEPARWALDSLEVVVGARAKQPTAEPAQAEADDPIATLRRYVDEVFRDEGVSCNQYQRTVEALGKVERDRAAHAAEVERARRGLLSLFDVPDQKQGLEEILDHISTIYIDVGCDLDSAKSALVKERARHDDRVRELAEAKAEVERLRGELAEAQRCADERGMAWRQERDQRLELEKLRDKMVDDGLAAELAHDAELAAARAERPMPTDEELGLALFMSQGFPVSTWETVQPHIRLESKALARAAKAALLGVRRREYYSADKDGNMVYLGGDEAEPKGQPEPATATLLDPPVNDHKPTLSQPADPLAGMPTPWRERIESL